MKILTFPVKRFKVEVGLCSLNNPPFLAVELQGGIAAPVLIKTPSSGPFQEEIWK